MSMNYRILFILFLIFLNPTVNSQPVSSTISAINPISKEFPGGRGTDQLVIYTPEYSSKTTLTNQYGIEVSVQNGRVISIGGNNSIVPKDGFIISGHGKAKDWMLKNLIVGSRALYNDNTLTIVVDLEAYGKNTQFKMDRTQKIVEQASRIISDLDNQALDSRIQAVQELTSRIEPLYMQRDSIPIINGLNKIDSILIEMQYLSTTSPRFEGRGIWYRPIEKNRDEILKTIDKIEKANFNMLFLECIWNGETIYPGKITEQKEYFKGFNPLQIFIEEGQKRGIEIHAWIHTFFVGYLRKTDRYDVGPILKQHPEWAIKKHDGSKVSTSEKGYLFVCPARPEVQSFIASLYKEIVIDYPQLGGIQLDYIRYPENTSLQESYCYCDYCRKEFKNQYHFDPIKLIPEKDTLLWQKWNTWRETNITRFVERVRTENKKSIISADIFPDTIESRKSKMQNWQEWAKKGLLDFIAPMAYSTEALWIGQKMKEMRSGLGKNQFIYCGLAPFMNLTPEMLVEQINIVRSNSIDGIIMFSLPYLSDYVMNLLRLGPFREKAIPPHIYRSN